VKPHAQEFHFFAPAIMTERPRVSPVIAETIAQWAHVECCVGVMLAIILETEAQTGLAMFYSLTSSRNQMGMVEAASRAKLTEPYNEVFCAFLRLARAAAKERHKLAHWCWILSNDLPDDLLLIDPSHQGAIVANMLGYHDPLAIADRSNIYVLTPSAADEILQQVVTVRNLASRLISLLWQQKDRGKRAELRQKLSAEPPMAEAIRRLRKAEKSSPESPP
jgi:hypothetical protein